MAIATWSLPPPTRGKQTQPSLEQSAKAMAALRKVILHDPKNTEAWEIGGWLLIAAFVIVMLRVCTKPERIDSFITNDYVIDTVLNDFVKKFDTINILRATTYNAVIGQCDSTPFNTADGSFINSDF